jgi:hypothetical protein
MHYVKSTLASLQAQECGWKGAPCEAVPITATLALRPSASPQATLKAFLHGTFNRCQLGRLFAALCRRDSHVVRDWMYTWAPLRQEPAEGLAAALVALDSMHHGSLLLPVYAVLSDAPPPAFSRLQVLRCPHRACRWGRALLTVAIVATSAKQSLVCQHCLFDMRGTKCCSGVLFSVQGAFTHVLDCALLACCVHMITTACIHFCSYAHDCVLLCAWARVHS